MLEVALGANVGVVVLAFAVDGIDDPSVSACSNPALPLVDVFHAASHRCTHCKDLGRRGVGTEPKGHGKVSSHFGDDVREVQSVVDRIGERVGFVLSRSNASVRFCKCFARHGNAQCFGIDDDWRDRRGSAASSGDRGSAVGVSHDVGVVCSTLVLRFWVGRVVCIDVDDKQVSSDREVRVAQWDAKSKIRVGAVVVEESLDGFEGATILVWPCAG